MTKNPRKEFLQSQHFALLTPGALYWLTGHHLLLLAPSIFTSRMTDWFWLPSSLPALTLKSYIPVPAPPSQVGALAGELSGVILLLPPATGSLPSWSPTCSASRCPAFSATLEPDTQVGLQVTKDAHSRPPAALSPEAQVDVQGLQVHDLLLQHCAVVFSASIVCKSAPLSCAS